MTKSVEKANRSTEPTLIEIGNALRALEGEPAKRTRELMNTIFELAGSKQIDWSDPDRWIEVELTGELQRLARKVWEASGRTINPRFLYSHLVVINRLALLQPVDGILPDWRAWEPISCRRRKHPARARRLAVLEAAPNSQFHEPGD
jgi:hypothetical protein